MYWKTTIIIRIIYYIVSETFTTKQPENILFLLCIQNLLNVDRNKSCAYIFTCIITNLNQQKRELGLSIVRLKSKWERAE